MVLVTGCEYLKAEPFFGFAFYFANRHAIGSRAQPDSDCHPDAD